jgi:hypothetical protein
MTGASFVVGLGLVALAALAWIWLWADQATPRPTVAKYVPALADIGMVALWLHALALATAGAGFWSYVMTGVLVCAAAVLRHPPTASADEDHEEPVAPPAPAPVPEREVAPPPRAGGLWASR